MKGTYSLKKIYILAAIALLLGAANSIGFHQSDEHYQILEFAVMRSGQIPASELPWEYAEQMRPGLQPVMAYGAKSLIGNPFWTAWFLRLLSGAFTFFVALLLYRRYAPTIKNQQLLRLFAGLCFLHWIMLYSGGRFSSESWSGLSLALAFLLYPLQPISGPALSGHQLQAATAWRYLLVGLLFGLSFSFRYQIALAILGFGAWLLFIARERWWRLGLVILGGLIALAIGSLADYWLYGEWVNAPYNYLAQNLLEGKAATFGSRPWWGYFELVFLRGIPPISLIYIGATLVFCWRFRKDPISWMWIPFLFVHSYLARKDVRFLFPLLPLLPIVIIRVFQLIKSSYSLAWNRKYVKVALGLCIVLNFGILTFNSFRPLHASVGAAHYLYHNTTTGFNLVAPDGRPFKFFDLPAHFYRSPDLKLVEACPDDGRCFYLLRSKEAQAPAESQLVWSNEPFWLPKLGVNWYYIFERE